MKTAKWILAALVAAGAGMLAAEDADPCGMGQKGEAHKAKSGIMSPSDTMKAPGYMGQGMMKPSASMGKGAMQKRMMKPPFGNPEDIAYAKKLWPKLHEAGYDRVHGHLYVGGPPHGKVREVTKGVVDGHLVIVKTNYRGKDVTVEKVKADPQKYLKAVTVMVKRPGYDPEDKDWFWIKYAPDGSVMSNPKGMKLAGRVAKGKPVGCISCHQSASGNDFVFSHNRTVNAEVTWIGDATLKSKFFDLTNP